MIESHIPLAVPSLKLGTTVNVLNGFSQDYKEFKYPYFSKTETEGSLKIVDDHPEEDVQLGKWSFSIKFCPSVYELFDAVYDFETLNRDSSKGLKFSSAALLSDETVVSKTKSLLSDHIGIKDLEKYGGFVFVELRRSDKVVQHPVLSAHSIDERLKFVNDSFNSALGTLPSDLKGNLDRNGVESIFNFSSKIGTHFISRVEVGDRVYQVFAYSKPLYDHIIKNYPTEQSRVGEEAYTFAVFTTPAKDDSGYFGYCTAYGSINNNSNDRLFSESLQKGEWNEPFYSKRNSIFKFVSPKSEAGIVLAKMNRISVIKFEFTNLTYFMLGQYRYFKSVLKGAIFVKHSKNIQPNFDTIAENEESVLTFKSSNKVLPLTSHISTPTMDIFRERLDLSELVLRVPEVVESLLIVTNVLVIPRGSKIELPGKKVTIVTQYLISYSEDQTIPELVLTESAKNDLNIFVRNWCGNLLISSLKDKDGKPTSSPYLVLNHGQVIELNKSTPGSFRTLQLHFNTPFTGHFLKSAQGKGLAEKSMAERLSLLFDLAIMNTNIVVQRGNVGEIVAITLLDFCDFIQLLVPDKENTSIDLAKTKLRAVTTKSSIKMAIENTKSVVPYLSYDSYHKVVESLVSLSEAYSNEIKTTNLEIGIRKIQEKVTDLSKELNENIRTTGDILVKFIKASAEKEGDLNKYSQQQLEKDREDLKISENNVASISSLLTKAKNDMDTKRRDVMKGYAKYENDQCLKLFMDVCTTIFEVGKELPELPKDPIGPTVKLVKGIVSIKKSIDGFQALTEATDKMGTTLFDIAKQSSVLSELSSGMSIVPSDLEYQEFSRNNKDIIERIPDEVNGKSELATALDIFVLRGQALLKAKLQSATLQAKIFKHSQESQIAKAQKERLDSITQGIQVTDIKELKPENIDLLGLINILNFYQLRASQQLGDYITIQDRALSYEYLEEPTPIDGYDILSLINLIAQQNVKIINARSKFNPPPKPFKDISISTTTTSYSLENGKVYDVNIPITTPKFYPYVMVRVNKVKVSIKGIKSPSDYNIHVTYSGDPFYDRDLKRQLLEFQTIGREFDFVYDKDGNLKFGTDEGANKDYSHITPFSKWSISIPKNETNKNVTLEDNITIEFTFEGNAIWRDTETVYYELHGNKRRLALAANSERPTEDKIAQEMTIAPCLLKWDAILCMNREKVNKVLLHQFKNDQQYQKVPREMNGKVKIETLFGSGDFIYKCKFQAPDISFSNNDSIFFKIGVSGTCETVPEGGTHGTTFNIPTGAYLQGGVSTNQLHGTVTKDTKYDIKLNLETNNNWKVLKDNASPEDQSIINKINMGLTELFAKQGFQYLLTTISSEKFDGISDHLIPKSFYIKTIETESHNNIMIININTHSDGIPSSVGITLSDPIPKNREVALYVNQNNILKMLSDSFKSSIFPFDFQDSGNDKQFSSLKTNGGSFTATLHQVSGREYSTPTGNTVVLPLDGATIKVNNGVTKMELEKDIDQKFFWVTYIFIEKIGYRRQNNELTVNLHLSLNSNLSYTLNSSDKDKVDMSVTASNINFNPVIHNKFWECFLGMKDIKEDFFSKMDNIPEKLKSSLSNVKLKGVSVLALKSLLFPGSYLTTKALKVPGDLVMFGDFADF